jgi:hypothetical protein
MELRSNPPYNAIHCDTEPASKTENNKKRSTLPKHAALLLVLFVAKAPAWLQRVVKA